MTPFRTLTAKLLLMGSITVVFFSSFVYLGFLFTHHIKDDAVRINTSGKLRYYSYDMLALTRDIVMEEDPGVKEALSERLVLRAGEFTSMLSDIRRGNKEAGLKPLPHRNLIGLFDSIEEEWEGKMMPLLIEEGGRKGAGLKAHDEAVGEFVDSIDEFVDALVKNYRGEIRNYERSRYLFTALFVLVLAVMIIYMRRNVVMPVKRLMDATSEVEKGNFDFRLDVKGRDEIGVLTGHYNMMAKTTGLAFEENRRLIKNLNALHDTSNEILRSLNAEMLFESIAERARGLLNSRYAVLSIFGEKENGIYEQFIPAGMDEETVERLKKTAGLPRGKGLLGHLAKEGRPIRADDISNHPQSAGFPEGHPRMKTFLGVPVILEDKAIGRLYFTEKSGGGAFTEEDEEMAVSFAGTAALAIHNARLLNDVRERKDELDILNKIAGASSRTLSLKEMLDAVIDVILGSEPLKLEKKGAIFLCDEEKKTLSLAVSRNLGPEHGVLCSNVPYGECLCGICAESGRILVSESNVTDARHSRTYPDVKEHGHIVLPLKSGESTLGVLCLYLASGIRLSEKQRELYESVSDILAIAVNNALNHRQVAVLAQSLESNIDLIRKHSEEVMALAEASNAVLTAATEITAENLYETICDMAVRKFGLRMAWLGLLEEGSRNIKPVSQAGFEDGYLEGIKITWDDSPSGMGPGGMSVKTRRPFLQNIHDTGFEPWRKEAEKRGYESVLGVPLILTDGRCIGSLLLYSGAADYFTLERIDMFAVLANQAATAIENRRLIEGLEEKIKERTQELEAARNLADAANRAKSDFLANMSHELRTPLNSVLGFSRLMADGVAGPVSDKQKEYLKDVVESGEHLLSLISDILDLSKIEAGRLEIEASALDLRKLIEGAFGMFKEKALRHGIRTETHVEDSLGSISADERKLKQALINLLGNAFKFTPEGGKITVNARRAPDEEGAVEISVTDTGIGIREEDMPRLFQPFMQLQSVLTKEHEGTGLGLALSKRLVELHGGSIRAESSPGEGSRFIVRIPLVEEGRQDEDRK